MDSKRREVGQFLATSDDIDYNTIRCIVDINDSKANFKGKTKLKVELQVHDDLYTDPTSNISIEKSIMSNASGDVFDANNKSVLFNFFMYRPLII